jgi:hypothetical protein
MLFMASSGVVAGVAGAVALVHTHIGRDALHENRAVLLANLNLDGERGVVHDVFLTPVTGSRGGFASFVSRFSFHL